MSMQRVPTLKKDMNVPVMMDSWATDTRVKISMSAKTELMAATRTLSVRIPLARFSHLKIHPQLLLQETRKFKANHTC